MTAIGINSLITIIGWLLAPVCAALISMLFTQKKIMAEKQNLEDLRADALENGVRALLRQKLVDYHKAYVIEQHECSVRVKEEATKIHEAYTALGGNSTGTQMYQEIMQLKTKG